MKFFGDSTKKSLPKTIEKPRYRTIRECRAEIKKTDNDTAITEYFIRKLCKENKIKYLISGNKYLVSLDDLFHYLSLPPCN